ncbi:putative GPI anchored protein, partial [Rhizodiscina lignyota]
DLGLVQRDYKTDRPSEAKDSESQWARLVRYVQHLNNASPKNVQYKVLILGRHGQGWHNVAEEKYGTAEWDASWSMLEGDGKIKWADALLTEEGEKQALAANKYWGGALERGQPAPDSYYSSPLSRCLQTANFTFTGLTLPQDKPFKPVVKELLRETNGVHTCDRRSSLTQLRKSFPSSFMSTFTFEPGFSDKDPLWSGDERETDEETETRVRTLLNDIFTHDKGVWVSMTTHSGACRAILAVVQHREFPLKTGSVMAVLVRAEEVVVE